MSNAPNCPISNPQQKIVSQGRAIDIASVPTARDLPSVITAINAMNNIVQHITRGVPQINNVYINIEGDVPVPSPKYARYTWSEKSRSYRIQQVCNPDDQKQVIEIMVLADVEWVESLTGHTLEYRARGW